MTETSQQPRVCVEILGGLGNQMFGAAAALALADRLNAKLEFEISALDNTERMYELDRFGLAPAVKSKTKTRQSAWARLFKRKRPAAPPGWNGAVWREKTFHYDPSFETLSTSTYLIGYMQSPKYFEPSADLVRRSFDLRPHLSEAGKSFSDATAGDDSVAVHIRRGDYVSNPKATAVHGILDASYYERALRMIKRAVPNARLFVVSDEPDAAHELLHGWSDAQFVTGTSMFDDMHIISACRHRIIANSSFSWWGAWLDPRPDAITIAPRAWFARKRMLTTYVDDLYPPGWFLT